MNDSVNTEISIEIPSLITYVKEYGESLLRIDAEKELQKAMAEKAESHHSIKPSHFKKAATAYYKDKVNYPALNDGACGCTRTILRRHRAPR